MIEITGHGGYVPLYRIEGADIGAQQDARVTGEVAVPGRDENHITMAANAAETALARSGRPSLAGLFVASVSDYFAEHGIAAHVAYRLDQTGDVRTADFQGTGRAATDAFMTAREVVRRRSAPVLVVGVDILPSSIDDGEVATGAGAGAVVLAPEGGDTPSMATLLGCGQATTGFVERHRLHGEAAELGDERFELRQGYLPAIEAARERLAEGLGTEQADYELAVSTAPAQRMARAGVPDTAEHVSTADQVGYAGAASFFLDTVHLLESSPTGIVLAQNYGAGGADAVALETHGAVERPSDQCTVSELLEQKEYVTYLEHRQRRERTEYEGVVRT